MTLVNMLLFTTAVYSSGPVTPWMWNRCDPSASVRQKPRSAHIRAVSTSTAAPSRYRKSTSPVISRYLAKACAMSASM